MMLNFIPIHATHEENAALLANPVCKDVVQATMDFYTTIGFNPPWIGYVVKLNREIVGSAGYKGQPVDNRIEIAYGTFPSFQHQGIGTRICRRLVEMSINTNPAIIITARTHPDNKYSIAVVMKNRFTLMGMIHDKEDGYVQEWVYIQPGK